MSGEPRWKAPKPEPKKPARLRSKSRKRTRVGWTEEQFKAAVKERANGRCEAETPVCSGRYAHAHHVGRRRGPDMHDPDHNGLGVCLQCHEFIHSHPLQSYERGWLRRFNPKEGDFFYGVAS